MRAPIPANEDARVAALQRLGILDQPPATDLEAVTRIAAHVTGAPFSVVNVIDTDRQWPVAATGALCSTVDRDNAMCAHTIADDATIHTPDARLDPRFHDNPHVDGRLGTVTFYLSIPLHDHEGYPVGALCVADPAARVLDDVQLEVMHDIAAQAEQLLELRRRHVELLDVLAEVDHRASCDPLTGLVNRRVLNDRLTQSLARADRHGTPPVVFFCDVDGFKTVNDRFGHDVGDQVLISLAQALTAVVRPQDTVARLGGDEFVVLCEGLPEDGVERIADRLRWALRDHAGAPAAAAGIRLSVGIHRGVPPTDPSAMLSAADRTMYDEKRRSRQAALQSA